MNLPFKPPKIFVRLKVRQAAGRALTVIMAWLALGPHASWALDPGLWNQVKPSPALATSINLPSAWVRVSQTSPGQLPRVIHIQDLHCDYATQTGIQRLLEHLRRERGISLILTEGASLPVNVTKLRTFPSPQARSLATEFLLEQGRMSGAEAFTAGESPEVRLIGVEDRSLYAEEQACLRRFFTLQIQGAVENWRDGLNRCKPQIFSAKLASLDHLQAGFEQNALSPRQFGLALKSLAIRWNLPEEPNAPLEAYLENRERESPDTDPETLRQFLEVRALKLRAWACASESEKKLDDLLRRFTRLETCLSLSATPHDLDAIRQNPEQYAPEEFSAYLASMEFQPEPEETRLLEAALREALHFYDLADKRSLAFVRNTRSILEQTRIPTVVLVTGGYHTPLLLKTFQKYGLTYCSMKIASLPNPAPNPYFSLLTDGRVPLEKMLGSKWLALPPFSAQVSDAARIVDEHALSAEMARTYDFLEALLQSLGAIEVFNPSHFDFELFKLSFSGLMARYPARSNHVPLDLDRAIHSKKALLIPIRRGESSSEQAADPGQAPFILIYPAASSLQLPIPASLLSLHEKRLAFYPGAMRSTVEKLLSEPAQSASWRRSFLKLVPGINFPRLAIFKHPDAKPAATAPKTAPAAQGKMTVLPIFTELLGDLKLAAGLVPILEHFTSHPPSWSWTLGSLGLVMLAISASSMLSNWIMAKSQGRKFSLREMGGVFVKEWRDYLKGWVKFFKEFKENHKFQPKASWIALGLLVLARIFDYGTQFFKLNQISVILAYSAMGAGLMLGSLLALRNRRRTAWFAEMLQQSLRITGAVVIVQLLKLPFAFALLAIGAGQLFTERVNDALLKWLKKVVGVLSLVDLFTSLRSWILKRPGTGQGRTENTGVSQKAWPSPAAVLKRLWHLANPKNPVSQLFYLFMLSNILFMNFYFSIPLQILLTLQFAAGGGLLGLWILIFKNIQVSQKVKMISLTGILPAVFVSVFQAALLLLALGSVIFAQVVPSGLLQALAQFQVPVSLGQLTGFVAMMYSLLGFSSIMKDQVKFDSAASPAPERLETLRALILARLEQAAPLLSGRLSEAEIQALRAPIALHLFSNAGQPEWLKEFFGTGVHVYKENVYMRRRLFNLLNDATLADLIFLKILKRKLPLETAQNIASAISGRDGQQDEILLRKILQGGPVQEMDWAIALMNRQNAKLSLSERAELQRQALEKRYSIKLLNQPGTYARELAGSWPLLNQKMKIMLHYKIPLHPYFLRLGPARLLHLGRLISSRQGTCQPSAAECRRLLETGELDAQPEGWARIGLWAVRFTPRLAREPLERLLLKHVPGAYLYVCLRGDDSRWAILMRDRRTPLGRAFLAWAAAPQDRGKAKAWFRLSLDALDPSQSNPESCRKDLAALSRFSRKIPLLRAVSCGDWLAPRQDAEPVWLPGFVTESGSFGLRGTLADWAAQIPVRWNFRSRPPQPQPRIRLLDIAA